MLIEQGCTNCPEMAAELNRAIRRATEQALPKSGNGRAKKPGDSKKVGLLKGKRRALSKAANSLATSLRCEEAPRIGKKARKAVETAGVSIPVDFNREHINLALHTVMTIKKGLTKSIGSEFYTSQRREIGRYANALIKAGYNDTRAFWTKLMGKDRRPHVFREVRLNNGEYSSNAGAIKKIFAEWWGKQFAAVPDNVGHQPWLEFITK